VGQKKSHFAFVHNTFNLQCNVTKFVTVVGIWIAKNLPSMLLVDFWVVR